MDFLYRVWDTIRPHVAGLGLVVTWVGIALVAWRRRRDWKSKRFTGLVNFSLNYVADNKLMMRTLLEVPANAVWLNEYGVKLVMQAAAKTRADQPFIVLNDPADMQFVKHAILNVISQRFAEPFLGHVVGAPVHKASFLFALTFEKYADMRTRKFRVLLVEESSLPAMFGPDVPDSQVEEVNHKDRIGVLRMMASLAAKPGARIEGADVLGRVELGVVA
jgi:hypothetical protein